MKRLFLLNIKGTTISLITLLIMTGCLAFNIGDAYRRIRYGVASGVYLDGILMEKKLKEEVYDHILSIYNDYFIRPRNAYLDPRTGQMLPEIYGQKIDVEATVEIIMQAEPYTTHYPVIVPLEPEITVDIYRNINTVKGSFTTWFGGGNRGYNIRLAASAIHNYLLAPGEVFSFNRATMPRDVEHGYKLAPIIVGGAVIPGAGGGVCQVSTTLYNAVKRAGLEIVERFPHSRPVGYVPKGMDATVSDYLDFKFRNNKDKFIMIKTAAYGGRLVVEIWE